MAMNNRKKKERLLRKENNRCCYYCKKEYGSELLTVDHVIPKSISIDGAKIIVIDQWINILKNFSFLEQIIILNLVIAIMPQKHNCIENYVLACGQCNLKKGGTILPAKQLLTIFIRRAKILALFYWE